MRSALWLIHISHVFQPLASHVMDMQLELVLTEVQGIPASMNRCLSALSPSGARADLRHSVILLKAPSSSPACFDRCRPSRLSVVLNCFLRAVLIRALRISREAMRSIASGMTMNCYDALPLI